MILRDWYVLDGDLLHAGRYIRSLIPFSQSFGESLATLCHRHGIAADAICPVKVVKDLDERPLPRVFRSCCLDARNRTSRQVAEPYLLGDIVWWVNDIIAQQCRRYIKHSLAQLHQFFVRQW